MLEIDSTRGVSNAYVSRRAVVGTAAWSAPAIVALSAAPAFAAASTVLIPSLDTNSFRAGSDTALAAGTPSSSNRMAISVSVLVQTAGVTGLTCVVNTRNSGQQMNIYNNATGASRGGTVWLPNNASLDANGWALSGGLPGPLTTGPSASTFTFTRGTPVAAGTSVPLPIIFTNVDTNDFPMTFAFTAPNTPAAPVFTVQAADIDT